MKEIGFVFVWLLESVDKHLRFNDIALNAVKVFVLKIIIWGICVPDKVAVTYVETDDPDKNSHDW